MMGALGYVQAVERARALAKPGTLAEQVWLAAMRAGVGGAFPMRDASDPLLASREVRAVVALMERLPPVVVDGSGVQGHG